MILHYENLELDKLNLTDLELRVFKGICERSSAAHTLHVKDLTDFIHSFKDVGDRDTVRKTLVSLTAKDALLRRDTLKTTTFYLHPNPYACWKGSLRNQDYQRDVWDDLKHFS